jgi:proline iminopeptidase
MNAELPDKNLKAKQDLYITKTGYVDSNGVMIYFKTFGTGTPMLLLHGGPGVSHDYLVQPLLPLMRLRQLVFIDERGCGNSQNNLPDSEYTLALMVEDVENTRIALGFEKIDVFGHSFGGILAQAYAIKYPHRVSALLLAGTGSSAQHVNSDLLGIKNRASDDVKAQIDQLERDGIYGKDGAQLPAYRKLVDQTLTNYMYVKEPAWDSKTIPTGWDAMRVVWGDKSDYEATGDVKGFDFIDELKKLNVRTLIIYGSSDIVSDRTAQATHAAIAGSVLVRLENAAHEMYVDQPITFFEHVEKFLCGR